MADKWTSKEVALSQRHEEILLRREVLLRGMETYYDRQEARSASFISDFRKAKERNATLLSDLKTLLSDMREQRDPESNHRFRTLVTNYWTMVRKVYPEWLEEQREYERQHGLPPATLPDPNVITGNMSARSNTTTSRSKGNISPRVSPRARMMQQSDGTKRRKSSRSRSPKH